MWKKWQEESISWIKKLENANKAPNLEFPSRILSANHCISESTNFASVATKYISSSM